MSHFSVLVIGENADEQLAIYDENLELPMHQVATREELIACQRRFNENYKRGLYAKYMADPEKYVSECDNPGHIEFLKETFPKMLEWSDDECYENQISDYRDYINEGESWCEIHEDGSLWTTTNENAKHDYYLLGGRYRGKLHLKVGAKPLCPLYDGWPCDDDTDKLVEEGFCDRAYKGDIDNWLDDQFMFFAVVKDGEWHERGQMGWWGVVSDEKLMEDWKNELKTLLSDVPDDAVVSVYDCHI